MTAAPRQRRICSSVSATAVRTRGFSTESFSGEASCEWMILSKLLASQSSFSASALRLLIDRWNSRISLGTTVCLSDSADSAAFAKLFCREHLFLPARRAPSGLPLDGAGAHFVGCFLPHIATIRLNCDGKEGIRRLPRNKGSYKKPGKAA
jgi:hypothetical protein